MANKKMIRFFGREKEMSLLTDLKKKPIASLVVCRGRRRIGKSRLIQKFGEGQEKFLEFQGLHPTEGGSKVAQLRSFSSQLTLQTGLPDLPISEWPQAFSMLEKCIDDSSTVILLDEISWMATGDKDFAGHLKIAWDTLFKKHNNVIVVLCGSVSSWIKENILKNAGFVGRVSLDFRPGELPLHICSKFWQNRADRISPLETLKLLSVTGGVPRYLEEIITEKTAEENIKGLCFNREGFLFSEFDKIFDDIFLGKSATYKAIAAALVNNSRTVTDICNDASLGKGGNISAYIKDLLDTGFVKKEMPFKPGKSQPSNVYKYRLNDNYLRFYLKYIEPNRQRIEDGVFDLASLERIFNWDSMMGVQFETLVINNLKDIIRRLRIPPESIRSASPYFQSETKAHKGCQIDLMIQTRTNLYVCEIKFKQKIGMAVVGEVQEKISRLKIPRNLSIRPVLIYEGELTGEVVSEDYFDKLLKVSDLFLGSLAPG
jgi:AAA+ ATPase superfamily predicted ATPase